MLLDSLQGASVLQGLTTSREVLQVELGLHFHPKESYGSSDQLRGGKDICSYSMLSDSEVSGYSMAMYSHPDTIQSVKLDVCTSLCF